jgi:hypothetical protein
MKFLKVLANEGSQWRHSYEVFEWRHCCEVFECAGGRVIRQSNWREAKRKMEGRLKRESDCSGGMFGG